MHKHVFGHDLYFPCAMQPDNVFTLPLAHLLKETLVSVKICVSRTFPHGVLGIYSVCANSLVRAWGDISAQRAAESGMGSLVLAVWLQKAPAFPGVTNFWTLQD